MLSAYPIRAFFNAAWKQGFIQDNPARKVDILKVKEADNVRRPFNIKELKLILDHANQEWRGMILCGIYTGQRLGDIARLTWNNIDLLEEEIRFITAKTGKRVQLPIAEPLKEYLLSLTVLDKPDEKVFLESCKTAEKYGTVSQLSKQFYNILVSAGLAQERKNQATGKGHANKRKANPLSFHSLRHTATSLLKNAGVSEAVAMDIIGHNSKAISTEYTHIEYSAKRKALSAMPDITVL